VVKIGGSFSLPKADIPALMAFADSSQRGNALLQNAYSVGYAGLYDDAGATVEAQRTAYRLNVNATEKYLNASGTWTDPNAIGAAGHSGGPLFVTDQGKAYVAGNFTWANATGKNGAAGNPGGVGGMLLRPHEKRAIDKQLELAGYEADDLPKDVIQGSDQNDAGPEPQTYSESFVPADLLGSFKHEIIYANAGDDVVDGYKSDDEIYGGAGDDTLIGGDGADVFVIGKGADRIVNADATDRLYIRVGSLHPPSRRNGRTAS
jgi:Ca2+-binding RTX toxin-like protein